MGDIFNCRGKIALIWMHTNEMAAFLPKWLRKPRMYTLDFWCSAVKSISQEMQNTEMNLVLNMYANKIVSILGHVYLEVVNNHYF